MVDLKETQNHPDKQFFDELEKARAGMLHLEDAGLHSQPMTPTREDGTNRLWFFAKVDSELVAQLRAGKGHAHFVVIGKDHDFHACAMGHLREDKDEAKIEAYWNSIVAAWYEHGKKDPNLTLLAFDLETAEIWGSTDSSMKFGWEIAKANLMNEKTPEVGRHTSVKFR